MWETVMTAFAALVVGILVALKGGVGRLIERLFDRALSDKESVLDGMRRLSEMHASFHRILEGDSTDRVVLFAGTDSGGEPRPESKYFSTAIHGEARQFHDEPEGEKIDYMAVYGVTRPMDAAYIETLLSIAGGNVIVLNIAEMKPCKLRTNYETEGAKWVCLSFLAIREKKFLYLSVASYDKEFTPRDLYTIGLEVDRLKSILK